ncbi:hypothetical protein [Caballeronia sp. LZ035]|uniref:hypothetical protein n=1 Tax=Caballeronia sp. LZ035 TaxID=3038568 RepID=UPI002854FB1C|nr:hypothetical protein [Caballeronia sp. LZ035]MDR5760649.1 hypothetical protein [Caballeronia sp. LZ035]
MSKQFAVGRAALRKILSGIEDSTPWKMIIREDALGSFQIRTARDVMHGRLLNAGVWVIVALSNRPLGLASAIHTARRAVPPLEAQKRQRAARADVRSRTLADTGVRWLADLSEPMLGDDAHSLRFDTPHDGAWHLVDIPFAGAHLLSAASASPVTQIHAYGWTTSNGRTITF